MIEWTARATRLVAFGALPMHRSLRETMWRMFLIAFLVLGTPFTAPAADSKPSRVAGVDNTPMGPYRALAELSLEAFDNGDLPRAAKLSRVLERLWDAAEEHGGEWSLAKRDSARFEDIDKAMDAFINPVLRHATKVPDAAAVHAAYSDFLRQLMRGDLPGPNR